MGWIVHTPQKVKSEKSSKADKVVSGSPGVAHFPEFRKCFILMRFFSAWEKNVVEMVLLWRAASGVNLEVYPNKRPHSHHHHHYVHITLIVIYTTRFKDPFALQMFMYPHISSRRRELFSLSFQDSRKLFSFTFLGFQDTFFFYIFRILGYFFSLYVGRP